MLCGSRGLMGSRRGGRVLCLQCPSCSSAVHGHLARGLSSQHMAWEPSSAPMQSQGRAHVNAAYVGRQPEFTHTRYPTSHTATPKAGRYFQLYDHGVTAFSVPLAYMPPPEPPYTEHTESHKSLSPFPCFSSKIPPCNFSFSSCY